MKSFAILIFFVTSHCLSLELTNTYIPSESEHAIAVTNLICESDLNYNDYKGKIVRTKGVIEYRVYDSNDDLVASSVSEELLEQSNIHSPITIPADDILRAEKTCLYLK